jgi:hypothetical protein
MLGFTLACQSGTAFCVGPMAKIPLLALLASLSVPATTAAQLPDSIPPEPAPHAELPALASWIARWLPVVAVARYSAVDSTADFYAYGSDSVASARLDGCTLTLHEILISTVRGKRSETRLAIQVPLDQVDTTLMQPKIRQARLLLNRPNVLMYGQLVVPLRNRTRIEFITVFGDGNTRYPMLVNEHQVPFVFAQAPATRSALALRQAAARCEAAADLQ